MKFLALLFLVGLASASFYDALDQAANEIANDFLVDVEHVPFVRAAEDKEDLGEKLKDALDKIVEKIRDALERGKTVKEEYFEKLKELRDKLKEAKIDIGEKAKEVLQKLRDRIKEYLKNLLDKLGRDKEERSAEDDHRLQLAVRALDLRDIFRKLKQALLDKIDGDALKAKIEKLFGKGNEFIDQVFKIIKENGLEKAREKLLKLIDRILGEDEERQERSLSEKWQKVKDFFEKVKIQIKERFLKFGDWVKQVMGEKLEKLKDRVAKLKEIAKEIHEHGKELSKDVAVEALEFLRPYKEDLGTLWDQVKETVKEVLNRKEE